VKFTETCLPGAYIIDIEPVADDRGFFARSWCKNEFAAQGLNTSLAQCNISSNKKKGTLRGLHYQESPYEEAKLVRCTRGAIYDVIVDLRPESLASWAWIAVELSADNGRMLYIPEGFAHGFQTLTDDAEVLYHMSEFYHPEAAHGVPWNDPALGIDWPITPPSLSVRDQSHPCLQRGSTPR